MLIYHPVTRFSIINTSLFIYTYTIKHKGVIVKERSNAKAITVKNTWKYKALTLLNFKKALADFNIFL